MKYCFYIRLESIPPPSLQRLLRFELCFSALIRLLIVLRQSTVNFYGSIPFLVPTILSIHISLGYRFEPANSNTPVTYYGLSYLQFLLNHISDDFIVLYISIWFWFRPVHSRFRQSVSDILTIDIL